MICFILGLFLPWLLLSSDPGTAGGKKENVWKGFCGILLIILLLIMIIIIVHFIYTAPLLIKFTIGFNIHNKSLKKDRLKNTGSIETTELTTEQWWGKGSETNVQTQYSVECRDILQHKVWPWSVSMQSTRPVPMLTTYSLSRHFYPERFTVNSDHLLRSR